MSKDGPDLVPDHEVERCEYRDIEWLKHEARKDDVEIRPRGEDAQWFRVGHDGFACVWWPSNYSNRARLAHCFVSAHARGQGIGASLVRARIAWAEAQGADAIDTYAYNPGLFKRLGFVLEEEHDNGTHYMVKHLD